MHHDFATRPTGGRVTLVGGGPGAWDLITLRGQRALAEADVILTDHLGPGEDLAKVCDLTGTEVITVGKIPYRRTISQDEINQIMIRRARAGEIVARLKGGDPFVFGRGLEEVGACAAAGVPCSVVPGVSSCISVPELAGITLTHRGVSQAFTVVSGHAAPGSPGCQVDWDALGRAGGTIVVIMGVRRVREISSALLAAGRAAATPAAAIHAGSTPAEAVVHSTLGSLAEDMRRAEIQAPAVYVIGDVAGLGFAARPE